MVEEIGFENGRNSNFEGLVTLTLTLDPVIRHTVVHHSSTSTYISNFIEIEETFCGRTDGRTDGHFSPLILLGRLLEVDLKRVTGHPCHGLPSWPSILGLVSGMGQTDRGKDNGHQHSMSPGPTQWGQGIIKPLEIAGWDLYTSDALSVIQMYQSTEGEHKVSQQNNYKFTSMMVSWYHQ